MPKKRILWRGQDLNYRDVEKHFEFFDLSLRRNYTEFVDSFLRSRNIEGKILDVGCGFGILGMMICARDEFSSVVGLESSPLIVRASEVITIRRGYGNKVAFKMWEGDDMPFEDGEFDAVVSFLSLHKWTNLPKVFTEIERVRKKDSIVLISDFRRDQPAIPFQVFLQQTRFEMGKDIAADLKSSYNASYTVGEIKQLLDGVGLPHYNIEENKMLLNVSCGLPLESAVDQSLEAAKKSA